MGEKKRNPLPLPENSSVTGGPKKPEKAGGLHGIFSRLVNKSNTLKDRPKESGSKFEELFGDLDLKVPDEDSVSMTGDFAPTLSGLSMVPPPPPKDALAEGLTAPTLPELSWVPPTIAPLVPPPPPKEALEEIADDELASFAAELSGIVREIDQTSTGKNVEDVIRVGKEKFATNKEVDDAVRADEEKVVVAKAEAMGISYINLSGVPINPDLADVLPKAEALEANVALYSLVGKELKMAVLDPGAEKAKALADRFRQNGYAVEVSLCSEKSLQEGHSVYAIETDQRQEELKDGVEEGSFEKRTALENLGNELAIAQNKLKAIESQEALMESITESMMEGEGAVVGDLRVFEEVEKEDEWGLRKVKLKIELEGKANFKYNFIDGENRIVCPVKRDEWFTKVGKFKVTHLANQSVAKGVLALVERPGKIQFLSLNGEFYDATIEDIEAHLQPKPQSAEPVPPEGKPELRLAYFGTFLSAVSSFSDRYKADKKTKSAYAGLIRELNLLRQSLAEEDPTEVLSKVKGLIDSSELNGGHRAYVVSNLISVARGVKLVDGEVLDSLFPLAKIVSENCVVWRPFDNGLVLRITEGDRIRYELVTVEGKSLYPDDLAFDHVGTFEGQIAPVRKEGKWNFIRKAEGELVGEMWFDEVFEPRQGLTRVRVGQKFNYMTSDGRLLASEFFDEADDFGKGGEARVRVQNEKFSIDTKGGRVMSLSAELKRTIQEYRVTHSDKRMSKEEKERNAVALFSNLAVASKSKEFRREPSLGEELHKIFDALLAECPEKSDAIVALFGHFRKTLNAMVELEGGQKQSRSLHAQRAYGEIERILIRSDAPDTAKSTLRQFSLKMATFPWKKIDPLPIPLLASFRALLHGNPEEEVKLIPLLREMEAKTNMYASWSRDNLRKLLPDFEVLLARAGLQPSTQRKVRNVFLSKMTNSDSYWRRGSSVGGWQPVSQAGKELQGRSLAIPFHIPVSRKIENDIPKLHFAHLCKGISQGDLASVEKNVELFGKLALENPGYVFDYERMGLALFGAIKRLQESEPEALSRLLEPSVQALRKAVEKGSQKAQIHFILGELCEHRARSGESVLSWLSIGKHHEGLIQAADLYRKAEELNQSPEAGGKAVDPSSKEKLRDQIGTRHKRARGVLRNRTRVRWALLLALGLASASAAVYRFGPGISDVVDEIKNEWSEKPVGPKAEKTVPKSPDTEGKSKQPKPVNGPKKDKVKP